MTLSPPPYARELVGRDALLDEIRGLLSRSGRLVTLSGTGGIGKTRVAAAIAKDWPGEARFIALGGVRRTADVATAVAAALGLSGVRDAESAILEAVEGGLVVLDELEHLTGFGPVLARWVAGCPDVRWLATSRHVLGIPAEVEVEVPPLPVPEGDDLTGSPAAALFLEAAGQPHLRDDAEAIAAILRMTGGLPLAIELAAGRLSVLPLEALEQRLKTAYFETLRDPLAPERGLRSVLDDTGAALSPETMEALSECTVFAGSLTVDGAEAVLSLGSGALDALHVLNRWHLVSAHQGRIALLEPVRRFAQARLDPRVEQAAMARHAAWVAGTADRLVARHRHEPAVLGDIERLSIELRAVLERAHLGVVDREHGVAAGRALCVLYDVRGPTDNLLACAEAVLKLDPGASEASREAWCDSAARRVRRLAAENDPRAIDEATAAVEAADRMGHTVGRVRTRMALGISLHRAGKLKEARATIEGALALADAARADLRGLVLVDLALVVHDHMAYAEADALMEETLRIARVEGDRLLEAQAYGLAATMQVERGEFAPAERWNQQALEAWAACGDTRQHALAVLRGGTIADGIGDLDLAARRYAEGEVALRRVQARSLVAWARGGRGRIALVRGDVAQAAELLPAWQECGPHMADYYSLFAAVVAAWRGDLAATRAHVEAVREEKYGWVLCDVASIAAEGFAAEPGSAAAQVQAVRARERWAAHVGAPLVAQVGDSLVGGLERHAAGWVVARDGTWFRAPGGARSDLSNRRAPARILGALAAARHDDAGPLDVGTLFEAGWPGERVVQSAASNRVYVALSALRDAGLGPLIRREGHGWRLDPTLPIHLAAP